MSKTPVKMLVFTGEVIWEACAATSLQSAARAYLSRKRMDPCLGHLMARHHAAVRIQRAFRCRYMSEQAALRVCSAPRSHTAGHLGLNYMPSGRPFPQSVVCGCCVT